MLVEDALSHGTTGESSDVLSVLCRLESVLAAAPAAEALSPVDRLFSSFSKNGVSQCAAFDSSGGSGGYVEHIFRYAAHTLFAVDLWDRCKKKILPLNCFIDLSICQSSRV